MCEGSCKGWVTGGQDLFSDARSPVEVISQMSWKNDHESWIHKNLEAGSHGLYEDAFRVLPGENEASNEILTSQDSRSPEGTEPELSEQEAEDEVLPTRLPCVVREWAIP
jgi:hypothetical protein